MADNEVTSGRVRGLLNSQDEARASRGTGPSSCGVTASAKRKNARFGEPQKLLPIVFMVFTICTLWYIYVFYNCLPMIRREPVQGDNSRGRGLLEMVTFHYILVMLVICYWQSIFVHPGEIPDGDPQWEYAPKDGTSPSDWIGMSVQEMKKTGERRHCKWCGKYKPDRCHHCRVCRTCILKMDHHCPWIYNCVGFHNYKYFFLLLFYSVLALHLIVWTMVESVRICIDDVSTPFLTMFAVFFGETLAVFFAVLVTTFFAFHIWLVLKAMTTIEFCEKTLPKKDGSGGSKSAGSEPAAYDVGAYGNIKAVLGENPFLWLFPCHRPLGDGLSFIREEACLTSKMETGKAIRRIGHKPAQRDRILGGRVRPPCAQEETWVPQVVD